MSNMATSLILHKRIETTVAKAKALKMYVEPLVTKAKEDTTHSRRVVFSYLKDKHAVTELFRVIAPAVGDRPGGYTRILKIGFRLGDAADMSIIEFVDFNDTYKAGVTASGAPKARTRRGSKGASGAAAKAEGALAEGTIGEEGDVAVEKTAKKPAAAAKPAAKKPAASKPKAAPAPRASKTSGSKASSGRSVATKKG